MSTRSHCPRAFGRVRGLRALPLLAMAILVLTTSRAEAEESRWALLVGIDDYVDPGISDLTGSVNDVIAIREALVTAARFPSAQVFLLTSDDPANLPTRGNIRAKMNYLASQADSDDLVYVHFSLHAVVDPDTGEGYLLEHRTDPREYRSDALPVSEIKAWLEGLAAPKRLLVVDGCRNDPERGRGDAPNRLDERFSRGLQIVPHTPPSATAFTQVLFACSPGQRAYEWPGKDRGLFSLALEEALYGAGRPRDEGGPVTLGEVTSFVRRRVPELVLQHLPHVTQVPDAPDPPRAVQSYVIADAQPGRRVVTVSDLPRAPHRPAEVEALEEVITRRAEKPATIRITTAPQEPLTRAQARRVTIRYEADVDRGVKGYRYRLDDGDLVETPRAFADVAAPEPGTHTFQVQVQDWWGNWSPPARSEFTVLANRRPEVSFASPTAGARVNGTTLEVAVAGSDTDGRVTAYRLALDDPDSFVERADGRFVFDDLADGPHTLFAQAIDDEGAASLWQSLGVVFAYAEPERPAVDARPAATGTVDASTSADIANWTKGKPAPAIAGFSAVGNNAQGYPEYDKDLGGGVTMRFVLIPGGRFLMGSPEGEGFSDERPQHNVTVGPFLMARTECTQGQWQKVMGSNPSHFQNAGADAPVESVSWNDAQEFVRKTGLSLPSEAQWEYACRAGTTGATYGDLGSIAWYEANAGDMTAIVGKKAPNAFGLHDMLGNVWEWCEDRWHDNYTGAPVNGSAWTDGASSYRVYRGGGWYNYADDCRAANRNGWDAGYRNYFVGFRPLRVITE